MRVGFGVRIQDVGVRKEGWYCRCPTPRFWGLADRMKLSGAFT